MFAVVTLLTISLKLSLIFSNVTEFLDNCSAAISNGLVTTVDQYTNLISNTLDMSSVGYELYNFLNQIYMINQTNFSDTSIIKYLSNSNYHNICDVFIDYINSQPYF